MMGFFTSRLGKLLIALVAAAGLLSGAMWWGAGRERAAIEIEQLKVFIKTTEEVTNVEVSPTRADATERLRNNGWVR